MRRICVVGVTAAGKSTLSKQLADDLGLTHIELDALYHQPNWEPAATEQFQADLRAAMAHADETTDGWTMCGNYNTASDRMGQHAADTIVWLDLPKRIVMARVVRRTLRRTITNVELWNGNTESLKNVMSTDPAKNLVVWTWSNFEAYQHKCNDAIDSGEWVNAEVHHLRSPAEVEQFRLTAKRN